MAKTNQTHDVRSAHADLEKLRSTVEEIDCFSQGGFSEIAAIARLALLSLETPRGHRSLEAIARALSAISCKADDIQNCINVSAEQVGCNYVDSAERRRWDACQVARGQGV